jgi:hypothetical protein
MSRAARIFIAPLIVFGFLSANSSLISPANAETECIAWTIDDDGEFQCTEWANTDGEGDPDTAEKPTGLSITSRNTSSLRFSWDAYEGATGWVISFSNDNAETWKELVVQNPNAYQGVNLNDLKMATAMWVRIAALTPNKTPFSDAIFATTKGAKPARATVVDANGNPVKGGKITWRMVDNSAWSSRTYGLTDDGVNDFPAVPAGQVDVTLKDALTADGALVSGSWRTTLGFEKTILRLPSSEISAHTIRVVLPNGLPVIGAKVSIPEPEPIYGEYGCIETKITRVWVNTSYINEWGEYITQGEYQDRETCKKYGIPIIGYEGGVEIDSAKVVNGFSFVSQVGPYSGTTDINGNFTIYGFLPDDVEATVIYDDSIITQQQIVSIDSKLERVELEYMPWVNVGTPVVTVNPNQLVPIDLSVADAEIGGAFFRASPAKSPVPKGAPKASCKQTLTGTTNSKGKVTLKLCATKSGIYTLKSAGAASVKTIRVQVKNAAPMPVTSVTGKSPARGQAKISWGVPLFDGKSAIKTYTITAKATGKKTITKTITAKNRSIVFSGLANATTYQISIVATNAKGTSEAVTVKVPVA